MAAGYSIGVASDTQAFSEGIADGVVKPLEDAQQTLADLGDTSSAASDKVVAALQAEQNATDKTRAAHVAAGDSITQSYSEQAQVVQESVARQTETVSEGVDEQGRIVKEGVKGTAAALASSVAQTATGIDGTLEGITSSATSIFSQLSYGLAGLGPEFAIGAAAAAVGFGLIDGLLKADAASAQDLQDQIGNLVGELIKAGAAGTLTLGDWEDNLKTLATQTDSTKTSLSDLFSAADKSGNSAVKLADAYAGDTKGLKALDDAAKAKLATDEKVQKAEDTADFRNGELTQSINAKTAAEQKYTDYLNTAVTVSDKAAQKTKEYDEATQGLTASQKAAATQTAQLNALSSDTATLAGTLASDQEKYNEAAQTESDKTKEKVAANNAYTVQNILDTQAAELKALQSKQADEIKIYETFGSSAGAAVIKGAKGNTSLLAALATFSPAQAAQYVSGMEAQGKLQGAALTKGIKTAVAAAPEIPGPRIKTPAINTADALKSAQNYLNLHPLTISTQLSIPKRVP